MPKAKTLDRVALTRAKFGAKMYGDRPDVNEHRQGYSMCPSCGQETLIHEDGCKHCRSCGWSACG